MKDWVLKEMLKAKPITIEIVKEINKAKDQHFFDKDTMRFFRSKIHSRVLIDDKYFITSEKKCFDDETRVFSIREFDRKTGRIKTIQDSKFDSVKEAKDFLKD